MYSVYSKQKRINKPMNSFHSQVFITEKQYENL